MVTDISFQLMRSISLNMIVLRVQTLDDNATSSFKTLHTDAMLISEQHSDVFTPSTMFCTRRTAPSQYPSY